MGVLQQVQRGAGNRRVNLRTITFWVIYDPVKKLVLTERQFRKQIERCHIPVHCVIVKMKGHYVRPWK